MTYQAPVRDHAFILRDVLEIEKYSNLPGFADAPWEVVEQILDQAGKFTSEVLAPLNSVGDKVGCKWNPDFTVTTPPGFKDAYKAMVENGWLGLSSDPKYGGQGLPRILSLSYSEMSTAANMAFCMYPGLTHGAAEAIAHGASDELKDIYLPKMVPGEWGGTMNLTEPHCGTDLGLLRTKAVPNDDGTYSITGQKIWVSGGEHDMADNIVHLVLARIEGAPEGVKGISLFIVPKYLVNEDGSLGERNNAKCVGLEEKMGIHGNATCVMQYEDAKGWLVGEPNSGLKIMFVMMNEARVGVGLQGLGQAEAAYQAAAQFAKERLQMRSLTGVKNPDGPADPIIVHPDVRRMLLDTKAFVEGARCFLFWTSLRGDLAHVHPDEAEREKANDYMQLLTPVIKGFLTDKGFKACVDSMQVHGGSGFTEHFPVSQYLRDARITMIYEGTNGIQALDLIGRKLPAKNGRGIMTFLAELEAFANQNEDAGEELKPFVDAVRESKDRMQDAAMWLMQNGLQNPDHAAAASVDFMHLFGYSALAYMWAIMAKVSLEKIAEGDTDPFYANKLTTGRYYIERLLPDAASHLVKLKSGADTMMSMPVEAF
ncbi:MAG TPA: acyl-CoA dehydrogenase C-terminal domain-containing protein [Caulobacteraceae bacterium]|nr:acyl-CoA dehydrogenase C-terminal domain-containing protein [Caulobacteraceae bacterium]